MPNKLIFQGNCRNEYATEVFIYVSYGTKENPTDHHDKPLDGSGDFDNHLLTNVLPYIKIALNVLCYVVEETRVDYPYNSIIPAFIFRNRDHSPIKDEDLINIETLTKNGIAAYNKAQNIEAKKLSPSTSPTLYKRSPATSPTTTVRSVSAAAAVDNALAPEATHHSLLVAATTPRRSGQHK